MMTQQNCMSHYKSVLSVDPISQKSLGVTLFGNSWDFNSCNQDLDHYYLYMQTETIYNFSTNLTKYINENIEARSGRGGLFCYAVLVLQYL